MTVDTIMLYSHSAAPSPLQRALNVRSLLGSVQGQLSQVLSLVPMDYALPIALILAGAMVSNLMMLSSDPSPTHIHTTSQVPRFLTLRFILPSLALCGGIYCYERVCWTDRRKEAALKSQVLSFPSGALNVFIVR